ncbi:MAG: hypothetical protein H6861_04145 [Rhodospirillales bacterium]|nr:hypothetical protein [Rhodospirillales bacterium]
MRLFTMLACMILGLTLSAGTYAADDFGARFSEEAPTALSDPEEALAGIMPAAGEEQSAIEDEVQNAAEEEIAEEPVPTVKVEE